MDYADFNSSKENKMWIIDYWFEDFETFYSDSIPRKVMKELESNLKGWDQFGGREIKDAFVTCQARLLSNYTW